MINAHLTAGLAGLILSTATSAAPSAVRGPGPANRWFASTYLDTTCGSEAFQNFSGSGSSCNIIEDTKPPAEFVVNIGSILIGSDIGVYDFTFLPDQTCVITGVADIIHEVSGGSQKCVDISTLKPGSFHVENVASTAAKKSTIAHDARGPGPVSIWNVTTFGDSACRNSIQTFRGSGNSTCETISGQVFNPMEPLSVETQSVFVKATVGTYDFSFFHNQECQIGQTNQPVYQVNGGKCIPLGDLNPESFKVERVA